MKTRIFTLVFFGLMFFTVPNGYSQNLLTDGDFSVTTDIIPYPQDTNPAGIWCYFQSPDAEAYPSVNAGVFNYQIINGGFNAWEVQLIQGGFNLTQGNYYRLSFDVRADSDRPFGVFLGENGGAWTSLLGYENYYQYASTAWQTITIDFNASASFPLLKLSFEAGGVSTGIYFDNVMLQDIGPYPSIGVIGTAFNGWYEDVDMTTTDGVVYTLSDYPLNLGAFKFRQNNTWAINWGDNTFPTGTGFQDGPDIPVISASNYDITFNRLTGEYSAVCSSNCHPAIGMLGSAVPPDYGWTTDMNMSTGDGVTYFLRGITFADGEAKFRQDDDWLINWGGPTFPSGVATAGGPNIPVTAGNYHVTFNIQTGEYSFSYPSIGILGSSLGGWTEDIDLQTTDGVIYTLADYPFASGEVKFRQDNDWFINWGDYTFPTGYGYQGGPNVQVLPGNYNVTFNRSTGEYKFEATDCPVLAIQCPENIYTANTPGECGAYVYYPDVVPAANCGGEGLTITQTAGLASGALFPVGVTTNTFVLTNTDGESQSCSFDVYVYDSEGPVISNLSADIELWPPNHQMVPVTINYDLSDNCGEPISNAGFWIYDTEPDDGIGDGNTSIDYEVTDLHHVLLRAERAGNSDGRIYYIYMVFYDASWNFTFAFLEVKVPHDRRSLKAVPSAIGFTSQQGGESDVPFEARIWPNPGEEYFNLQVSTPSEEPVILYISDISGHIISEEIVTDSHQFRFGEKLRSGVYLATVRQGRFIRTIKIIRQ